MPIDKQVTSLLQAAREGSEQLEAKYLALSEQFEQNQLVDVLQKLLQQRPEVELFWQHLAKVHEQTGNLSAQRDALAQLDMISAYNDELRQAKRQFEQGELRQAESTCRTLLGKVPNENRALQLMANIAMQYGRSDIALTILRQCHASTPEDINVVTTLAQTLLILKQPHQVLAVSKPVMQKEVKHLALLETVAEAYVKTGKYQDAFNCYQSLFDIHPDKSTCLIRMGAVLKITGDIDKATDMFQQSISLNPAAGEAYWALANLKTHEFNRDDIAKMKQQLDTPNLPDFQRVFLLFSLGKAGEDNAQYAESFDYYAAANALFSKSLPASKNIEPERFTKLFNRDYFEKMSGKGHPSDAPIFIIGLPRSGSTLVEQILSSHSDVDGTIELTEIPSIALQLNQFGTKHHLAYPEAIKLLDEKLIHSLAEQYLAFAEPFRQGAKHFVDKLPANFQHLGLIRTLFPNAKIIDVRRNPLACGWSIFSQYFAGGVHYAYSLDKIAEYQARYRDLMRHWQQVLAPDILSVDYEMLVEECEATVTTLLDFCELPAQQACFDFHLNKRPVATPSAQQVRQPIYTKALEHWKHYEAFLGPLTDRQAAS